MGMGTLLAFIFGLFLLYIIGLLLVIPIKIIVKLIFNGILGGIFLLLFNLIGGLIGLSLVVNPVTAITVGILGVPGLILLLILNQVLWYNIKLGQLFANILYFWYIYNIKYI